MEEQNPYAKYLDGRPVEAILGATAGEMSKLLTEIGPEKAAQPPAPGKWSAVQIVCHLADCEIAFGFRLRQAVAEENYRLQPFDQDKWAKHYGDGVPVKLAVDGFAALRAWNLAFIEKTLKSSGQRTVTHPKRGTLTYAKLVEMIAGHDLNHLEQLRRLAGA